MIYLEHTTGKSSKFWEGRLEGVDMVTRWGKIGTDGQEKAKSFESAVLAQKALDKLVAQKQKKGYVEVEQEASVQPTTSPCQMDTTTPEVVPPERVEASSQHAAEPAPITNQGDVFWTSDALALVGGLPDRVTFELPELGLDRDQVWEDIQHHANKIDGLAEATGDKNLCRVFEVAHRVYTGDATQKEVDREVLRTAFIFWSGAQLERLLRYAVGSLGACEAMKLFVESLQYSMVINHKNKGTDQHITSYTFDAVMIVFPANRYGDGLLEHTEAKMHACMTLRRLMHTLNKSESEALYHAASQIYVSIREEHRKVIRALYPDDEGLAALDPTAVHHIGQFSANKLVCYDLLATRQPQKIEAALARLSPDYAKAARFTLPTLLYEQGPDAWVNMMCHTHILPVASHWVPMVRTPLSIKYWSAWLRHSKADTLGDVLNVLCTYPVKALIGCAQEGGVESKIYAHHLCKRVPGAIDKALAQSPDLKALHAFVPLTDDKLAQPEDLPELLTSAPWRKKKKAIKPFKVKGLEPPELPISIDIPNALGVKAKPLSKKHVASLRQDIEKYADRPAMLHNYYLYVRAGQTKSLLNVSDLNTIRELWDMPDEAYWGLEVDDHSNQLLSALKLHQEALFEFLVPLSKRYVSASVPVMSCVKSVQAARVMAEALHRLKSKRQEARQWFDAHPLYACQALLADAAGTDRKRRQYAESAFAYIAHLDVARAPIFEAFSTHYDDKVAEYGKFLLERNPLEMHPKLKKLPAWLDKFALHRPVLASDSSRQLDDAGMQALVEMCSFYDPESVYAGFELVKSYFTTSSLSKFALSLCELWLTFDGSSKLSWCMLVAGEWGDDDVVRALTPKVRRWPGESAAKRAQLGLETLACIGSDLALTNVYSMSQKMKFSSLQARARELVDDIAEVRGLTVLELGDRLIPDFDLDARGRMELDYGERTFLVTLNAHLQPCIKDVQRDKVIKSLPKPGKTDDDEMAKAARNWFKGFKKDLKTVATQQLQRLEYAMIHQRRWSAQDFQSFLVDHPLMITLTSRLLWGAFNDDDELVKSFRVELDHSLVDHEDEPVLIDGLQVGLLHSAQCSPTKNELWQRVMGDYEIIQPFEQLGRKFIPTDEVEALLMERVVGAKLPAPKLVYGLDKSGWERGFPYGDTTFCFYARPLQDGYTFHVHYEGATALYMIEDEEILTITDLYIAKQDEYGHIRTTLKGSLGHCSPILVSEAACELLRVVEAQ